MPSEPVHGVGSNLDLIKANDTAQASERRPLDLFRCCDDPRPFGICIWAISVWWPWPRRVAAISFSRVELRSSSSVSASCIEACSRPCLTAAMMF